MLSDCEMKVEGKNVLVVGLARSGLASANFLAGRGAEVTVTDIKDAASLGTFVSQLAPGVKQALGGHRLEDFLRPDFIVLSPGVPLRIDELQAAARAGVPIYSEIELAFRFLQGRLVGVTGSNGKTTTTTLIGQCFKSAGKDYAVAGNIGTPLISLASESSPSRTLVVELSSFQLETVDRLKCDISVLLNVTPDHLDRYPDFAAYAQAKERIFRNQTRNDFAVLNADDPHCARLTGGLTGRPMLFSRRRRLAEGVFVEDETIRICWEGRSIDLMPVREIRLRGNHNLEYVLAATAVAYLAGLDPEAVAEAVRSFPGVEHRLEPVRRLNSVDYYNDSKATNVDAATQALRAFDQPLIVIMGGLDKNGDFGALADLVRESVKRLILIGAATEKIDAALGDLVPVFKASSMEDAVSFARREAREGDVVLLAPACASFDMFDNYEHRGRVFKSLVNALPEEDDR